MTARIVADDDQGRAAAVETLRAGGIVALPTDTVYGIAVALATRAASSACSVPRTARRTAASCCFWTTPPRPGRSG